MSKYFIPIAAILLASMPMAYAAPDDDALVAQLKQLATQGQDPNTAAQVNQYIDQNKGAITALLESCKSYVQQLQSGSTADLSPAPANPPNPPPAGTQTQTSEPTAGAVQASSGMQASSGLQPSGGLGNSGVQASSGLQASTGLQTSAVQPSSGLQTSHLAGYPSLPPGDPIPSVTVLTADQVQYATKVRRENYDRKATLMNSASQ